MTYIAAKPETYDGKVIGTGQCVPFVQKASGAPQTTQWIRGKKIKGDFTITEGTAIATFNVEGKYTNARDGTSHAAVYISQESLGVKVWDQWKGQPVHQRTIRFQGSAVGVKPVNDGDAFYIVA